MTYGALSATFYQYREDIFKGIKAKNTKIFEKKSGLRSDVDSFEEQEEELSLLKKFTKKTSASSKTPPFYSWQCVTLYLDNKTIDFVIEDMDDLFAFLNFAS